MKEESLSTEEGDGPPLSGQFTWRTLWKAAFFLHERAESTGRRGSLSEEVAIRGRFNTGRVDGMRKDLFGLDTLVWDVV